ncbi:hypothetical protein SUGI_0513140 [Cryptomeria japonica]|nr:hypothetical protein SUGI_0513140 [Cryptomeria japonica]
MMSTNLVKLKDYFGKAISYQEGRLTMVRSVLSTIPVYSMSCFKMPHAIGVNLDNLLRKFVWDGAKDANQIPLINWETMCFQKEFGGTGLRKMEL